MSAETALTFVTAITTVVFAGIAFINVFSFIDFKRTKRKVKKEIEKLKIDNEKEKEMLYKEIAEIHFLLAEDCIDANKQLSASFHYQRSQSIYEKINKNDMIATINERMIKIKHL